MDSKQLPVLFTAERWWKRLDELKEESERKKQLDVVRLLTLVQEEMERAANNGDIAATVRVDACFVYETVERVAELMTQAPYNCEVDVSDKSRRDYVETRPGDGYYTDVIYTQLLIKPKPRV